MQVGRVFGIPLRIDWSWLLVFALMVWTLSVNGGPLGLIVPEWRVPTAGIVALTLFACVVVHELAHAIIARRYGIRTREIVLFVFGGVSRMERVGISSGSEAAIAIAGPATSFALAIVFALVATALPNDAASLIFWDLAIINVALAIFNLLPAYPMDGGRVVHALAWQFTESRERATKIAFVVSLIAGAALALGGLGLLTQGVVVSGVWIMFVAWFVLRSAQSEYLFETEIEPFETIASIDILEPSLESVSSGASCESVLSRMQGSYSRALPVFDGRDFAGLVSLSDFAKLGSRNAAEVPVEAIMTPASLLVRIAPETRALDALSALNETGFHQLPVIDSSGALRGLFNVDSVRRAIAFDTERRRIGVKK